eukprot:CAMPEP_0175897170 /NCGR_PEP_ID=MMETSP0108-20121206/572_1 /TAXON_ID=195067 ORGANISM="Goniomonas pacifica, Strain CCMP1869" /NCGR_SAMPLE_ID=MMETSP0108 /ASSEMBLY_ACC=CAM_ASM_000204 /LENGTH=51 /DNA_ID=CAMNT_0017218441 /DNA_START=252 /DNA_END=407 /DNA_ORIENTATION=-
MHRTASVSGHNATIPKDSLKLSGHNVRRVRDENPSCASSPVKRFGAIEETS